MKTYYDSKAAELPVRFISTLKLSKSPHYGKAFIIQDWQKDIIRNLFGNKRVIDNTRQYRRAYISFGRKNGKSTLCAGIGLYLLFCGERGGEIYIAASDREQASIIFNEAKMMILQDKDLARLVKIVDSKKTITNIKTNTIFKALSSDAGGKHGYNPSCVIMDELHTWTNSDLYDALTSGSGARTQPLQIVITTAGYDENSVCGREYSYASKVKEGSIVDPTYYSCIYEVPKDLDWRDEKNWYLANPALGVFNNIEYLRDQYKQAENVPFRQNSFKRLFLNQWTASDEQWLDMDVWKGCTPVIDPEALIGLPCYMGLDLSATTDLTAAVLVFPVGDSYQVLPYFWMPEDSITRHRLSDKVPYDVWVADGYITATPGAVVDYDYVLDKIMELKTKYDIQEIAFDRWNATQLATKCESIGITVVPFGQGFGSMSNPTKELLSLILSKRLHHGNNPVLNFMASCVSVSIDATENIKITKGDRRTDSKRVDGMIALVMGLDRAIRHGHTMQQARSIYETRSITVF